MKKIAIEEHMNSQDLENLEGRLKDMDEGGIEIQVLSFSPLPIGPSSSAAEIVAANQKTNDAMANVVEKYPKRFAAFASLPQQYPEEAAKELERTVRQFGFKGTMIWTGEQFLDMAEYQVLLEKAIELDVPLYLHPGTIASGIMQIFEPYRILTSSMWGFSISPGVQAMRFIVSGTFDRYPQLKMILGHMGENIPYTLWRIDNRYQKEMDGGPGAIGAGPGSVSLKQKPSQYFKKNFWITTSGMFWSPALQFACLVLGAERILFAVDYPPESALEASRFIDATPISDSDKEKICHLNAEKLLGI